MAFVFFKTFGCQMNVADSDEFKRKLFMYGFIETDRLIDADLVVVNTCSVRDHAEKRAKARIIEFASLKKKGSRLWIIGCMAQRIGNSLKEEIPGINQVIGAKEIDNLDSILAEQCNTVENYDKYQFADKNQVSDFVSVMRGCNNYCAYCIVPYVRGDEISISIADIEDAVKMRIDSGIKEITLLGQNVNSYNDNGIDFSDLVSRLSSIPGLQRLRFTTSHPKDFGEKLIRTIAETPTLCHHIHLPIQAGSDRILKAMNRKYSNSEYRQRVDLIRKYLPDADITTDIIVGFPSEVESEFKQTLQLVKDIRYTTAFMFAYSIREGTAAAKMVDDVPKQKKMERLNRLIEMQTQITREIYQSMIGKEVEIMVSGRQDKRDRLWMGQDFGCKRVLVACENAQAGIILKTKIVRSSGMTLIGECSSNA